MSMSRETRPDTVRLGLTKLVKDRSVILPRPQKRITNTTRGHFRRSGPAVAAASADGAAAPDKESIIPTLLGKVAIPAALFLAARTGGPAQGALLAAVYGLHLAAAAQIHNTVLRQLGLKIRPVAILVVSLLALKIYWRWAMAILPPEHVVGVTIKHQLHMPKMLHDFIVHPVATTWTQAHGGLIALFGCVLAGGAVVLLAEGVGRLLAFLLQPLAPRPPKPSATLAPAKEMEGTFHYATDKKPQPKCWVPIEADLRGEAELLAVLTGIRSKVLVEVTPGEETEAPLPTADLEQESGSQEEAPSAQPDDSGTPEEPLPNHTAVKEPETVDEEFEKFAEESAKADSMAYAELSMHLDSDAEEPEAADLEFEKFAEESAKADSMAHAELSMHLDSDAEEPEAADLDSDGEDAEENRIGEDFPKFLDSSKDEPVTAKTEPNESAKDTSTDGESLQDLDFLIEKPGAVKAGYNESAEDSSTDDGNLEDLWPPAEEVAAQDDGFDVAIQVAAPEQPIVESFQLPVVEAPAEEAELKKASMGEVPAPVEDAPVKTALAQEATPKAVSGGQLPEVMEIPIADDDSEHELPRKEAPVEEAPIKAARGELPSQQSPVRGGPVGEATSKATRSEGLPEVVEISVTDDAPGDAFLVELEELAAERMSKLGSQDPYTRLSAEIKGERQEPDISSPAPKKRAQRKTQKRAKLATAKDLRAPGPPPPSKASRRSKFEGFDSNSFDL